MWCDEVEYKEGLALKEQSLSCSGQTLRVLGLPGSQPVVILCSILNHSLERLVQKLNLSTLATCCKEPTPWLRTLKCWEDWSWKKRTAAGSIGWHLNSDHRVWQLKVPLHWTGKPGVHWSLGHKDQEMTGQTQLRQLWFYYLLVY